MLLTSSAPNLITVVIPKKLFQTTPLLINHNQNVNLNSFPVIWN